LASPLSHESTVLPAVYFMSGHPSSSRTTLARIDTLRTMKQFGYHEFFVFQV
jgi:hypothetical protein